jgi:hypothetical protein
MRFRRASSLSIRRIISTSYTPTKYQTAQKSTAQWGSLAENNKLKTRKSM